METELLRYFAVVARNLSFTRAAEVLGTTQPNLSRAMRRLEDLVGEALFDRSTRQITLTPSGAALLDDAQNILDQVGTVFQRARSAGRGVAQTLRVGYFPTLQLQVLNRGISAFRHANPNVAFDFRLMKAADQIAALRAGEIDVGLIQDGSYDRSGLSWKTIARSRLILSLPSEWGFGRSEPVALSALRDRPFAIADPKEFPDVHALQKAYFDQAGFQPTIARYAQDMWEIRFLVSAGICAAFAFDTSLLTIVDGIDFVPFLHPPRNLMLSFHMAWSPQKPSHAVKNFVETMIDNSYEPAIVRGHDGFTIEWERTRFDDDLGTL